LLPVFILLFESFDSLINYSRQVWLWHGLITFAVSFFIAAILSPFLTAYFNDNKWAVLKDIGYFSLTVFTIEVAQIPPVLFLT
tara:strand:+ start:351 stop:599 length:249 start_codon:yes stop_codon:yes gene_type:complete